MKKPTPITQRGKKTRAAILAAAEQLYGVQGYEGTSIVDITQAADVALGTFYIYFPNKKALFIELVDSLSSSLRHYLAERTAGITDRAEIGRLGMIAFFEFLDEHRHLYRIVRQADFVDQECFRRYYRAIAEPNMRALEPMVKRGEIRRGDPEVMAYCMMGIADFVGMRWGLWENKKLAPAVLADALAFIEGGMQPSDGPRQSRRSRTPERPRSAPAPRSSRGRATPKPGRPRPRRS